MIQSRRRFERIPFLTDVMVKNLATHKEFRGRSIDLSRDGIGFYSPFFLPQGSRVRLTITMKVDHKPIPLHLTAIVMRNEVVTEGTIVGAAFDAELTPAIQPILCGWLDQHG